MRPDENAYETDEDEDVLDTSLPEGVADNAQIPMMPPMMVLLLVVAGIVLDWLIPLNWGHTWGGLGLILLACAVALSMWASNLFEKAGTNRAPNKPATALVLSGPYKYTRNPMYLAFLVGYAGLAMLADAPIMLLLTGGLYYVLERYVIIPEEEYLEAKFKESYIDYKDSVRRWL